MDNRRGGRGNLRDKQYGGEQEKDQLPRQADDGNHAVSTVSIPAAPTGQSGRKRKAPRPTSQDAYWTEIRAVLRSLSSQVGRGQSMHRRPHLLSLLAT